MADAEGCYSDTEKNDMLNLVNSNPPQYATACDMFAHRLQCLDRISHDCDAVRAQFNEFRATVTSDFQGICEQNGEVAQCAQKAYACREEYNETSTVLKQHNITKACSLGEDFGDCIDSAFSSCPEKVKDHLEDQKNNIYLEEMLTGCDGACGKAMSSCFRTVESTFRQKPVRNNTLCPYTNVALTCAVKLNQTDCASNKTFFDSIMSVWNKRISDFCPARSDCNKRSSGCLDKLNGAEGLAQTDKAAYCQKVSATNTCLSSIKNNQACALYSAEDLAIVKNFRVTTKPVCDGASSVEQNSFLLCLLGVLYIMFRS
ncbi:uncharacterized protein LOC101862632 [Aplysia californica]|uniref:Uncharacterized protein LOC101862632 n=1 Tax=Aplysia californica TaxID=6500 RepID=A0ABM0ZUW1_APLCA|nr:uncharacterized protein LOC101862632 [Aplysia californica]